jgi:hypothetical protein
MAVEEVAATLKLKSLEKDSDLTLPDPDASSILDLMLLLFTGNGDGLASCWSCVHTGSSGRSPRR